MVYIPFALTELKGIKKKDLGGYIKNLEQYIQTF